MKKSRDPGLGPLDIFRLLYSTRNVHVLQAAEHKKMSHVGVSEHVVYP